MKKRSRKLISILLTLALLATLLVPMATPAAAGSTYTMSNVKTIAPTAKNSAVGIGSITVNLDAGSVTNAVYSNTTGGHYGYIELPTDFQFRNSAGAAFTDNVALTEGPTNYVDFPTGVTVAGTGDYAFETNGGDVIVTPENSGNRLKIYLNKAPTNTLKPGVVILQNLTVFVPSGAADGPVTATAVASSSSVFSAGKFDIAKIGTSSVQLAADSVSSFGSDGGGVTLLVKELASGAMNEADDSLKFTLPAGFKWTKAAAGSSAALTAADVQIYWNGVATTTTQNILDNFKITAGNEREIVLDNNGPKLLSGSYFKIKLNVTVDDTTAKLGNVDVSVGGSSSYTPSSFQVGTYGEFGQKLSVATTPDIYAGKYGQKVGNIVIEETLKGSLVGSRTLSLTLPSGAKWDKVPTIDSSLSTFGGITSSGATASFVASSSDARTVKYTVTFATGTATTDKAKLVFKDGEVVTAADFAGELKAVATGSSGFTGDLAVAKVKPAISATVTDNKELKIGVAGQAIGELTIEEAAKEMFAMNTKPMNVNNTSVNLVGQPVATALSGNVTITAPSGVTFEAMPTISVDGDVKVDATTTAATLTANKSVITIPIQSTSTKPSKILVKNIKLNVDRTVVEGDLKLSIGGTALIDDDLDGTSDRLFEPARNAAEVLVGKVVTPAPGDTRSNASFVIGKTTYTVAGVEKTMDVAPYVKNGRTYLPVRYVASALGVLDSNILWDEATQKVTLLKGDKVVQMTIGSTAMIVNGVTITMDSAPEITSGRTMLPFRFIAQAMGSSVAWDEATQTVTLN